MFLSRFNKYFTKLCVFNLNSRNKKNLDYYTILGLNKDASIEQIK
jgi:hypothetical protein